MPTLNELFRAVILENELSGNEKAALRFSDAGGKSGYSFGVSQLDVEHSDNAVACLKECGFTGPEISALQNKTVAKSYYNHRLVPEVVAKWDTIQLTECLNKALNFNTKYGIPVADTAAILAGADYCNQYGSQGQGAVKYYKSLGRPITAKDVLEFKLSHTKYGREHPGDCHRRYENIVMVLMANQVV